MDRLSDYDYSLPEDLIAQNPLADRCGSRLLQLPRQQGGVRHRMFKDVAELLLSDDLLVLNNTRVTALRLQGRKESGAAVEALLLKEVSPSRFEVMLKPARRLKPGAIVHFQDGLRAEVLPDFSGPLRQLQFDPDPDLSRKLAAVGKTPLPPYIRQSLSDPERYQTVYARVGGSAAAPTAGLHFTPELLDGLREKGVGIANVTLDVSLDTFRPVEAENLDEHVMHGETAHLSSETADAIATCTGRIVAVGTTVVRTLESFAVGPRHVETGTKQTKLFIRPGYRFQIVDGMFTNFHLPRTSMLMMISAMAGRDRVMAAYAEAVRERYRFLSFGDSMLIL
ncbi:MAG TPA: tRNA preQ1(34) S-adenosylmethionine ribosyltransferase-isomerase QueA [Fimbriimonadaceae bacterium]|nr:tRNA preQ1(34) S-adenosylmethionine ribosyltransferase-isomerase QueA [Fimbriimonadaceae bacterium]